MVSTLAVPFRLVISCVVLTLTLHSCGCTWLQRENYDNIYLFSDERLTWHNAFVFCQERAAHLVAVNDAAENSFLYSVVSDGRERWIGLHCVRIVIGMVFCDSDTELTWTNPDSSAYREWGFGNLNETARFVFMDFELAQWSVHTTQNGVKYYICEKTLECAAASPCANGGTCRFDADAALGYACSCRSGYTGDNCEVNLRGCVSRPCVNGDCVDVGDGYRCDCVSGFSGVNCTDDIDECQSDDNVCHSNGRCVNTIGSFACNCDKHYHGSRCQNEAGDTMTLTGSGIAVAVICAVFGVAFVVAVVYILRWKCDAWQQRRKQVTHSAASSYVMTGEGEGYSGLTAVEDAHPSHQVSPEYIFAGRYFDVAPAEVSHVQSETSAVSSYS